MVRIMRRQNSLVCLFLDCIFLFFFLEKQDKDEVINDFQQKIDRQFIGLNQNLGQDIVGQNQIGIDQYDYEFGLVQIIFIVFVNKIWNDDYEKW